MTMIQIKNHHQTDFIDNKNTPCILCRNESISITGNKYCRVCYIEMITNLILRINS